MKSLHLVKTSVGAKWAYRVMRDLVEMGDEVHVAMPTMVLWFLCIRILELLFTNLIIPCYMPFRVFKE